MATLTTSIGRPETRLTTVSYSCTVSPPSRAVRNSSAARASAPARSAADSGVAAWSAFMARLTYSAGTRLSSAMTAPVTSVIA